MWSHFTDFPLRRFWKLLAHMVTPARKLNHAQYRLKLACLRRTGMKIEDRVTIAHGFNFYVQRAHLITLGKHVAIEDDVAIHNFSAVTIGSFTSIGPGTILANGGHRLTDYQPIAGALTIGRGCFIGLGCRIIGPLTIGDNAVISAGSTVIADVPAGSVVAGVPGKVIGRRPLPKSVWLFPDGAYDPVAFEILPSRE